MATDADAAWSGWGAPPSFGQGQRSGLPVRLEPTTDNSFPIDHGQDQPEGAATSAGPSKNRLRRQRRHALGAESHDRAHHMPALLAFERRDLGDTKDAVAPDIVHERGQIRSSSLHASKEVTTQQAATHNDQSVNLTDERNSDIGSFGPREHVDGYEYESASSLRSSSSMLLSSAAPLHDAAATMPVTTCRRNATTMKTVATLSDARDDSDDDDDDDDDNDDDDDRMGSDDDGHDDDDDDDKSNAHGDVREKSGATRKTRAKSGAQVIATRDPMPRDRCPRDCDKVARVSRAPMPLVPRSVVNEGDVLSCRTCGAPSTTRCSARMGIYVGDGLVVHAVRQRPHGASSRSAAPRYDVVQQTLRDFASGRSLSADEWFRTRSEFPAAVRVRRALEHVGSEWEVPEGLDDARASEDFALWTATGQSALTHADYRDERELPATVPSTTKRHGRPDSNERGVVARAVRLGSNSPPAVTGRVHQASASAAAAVLSAGPSTRSTAPTSDYRHIVAGSLVGLYLGGPIGGAVGGAAGLLLDSMASLGRNWRL